MKNELPGFLRYLKEERGLSEPTRDSYLSDLGDFLQALAESGVTSAQDTMPHHVSAYLQRLREQAKSPATLTRRLVSIRAFFHYLNRRRVVVHNPALLVDSPKPDRRRPQTLSVEQMRQLLDAPPPDTALGVRDRAILEAFYAAGLRVSEVALLDVDRLHLDYGFIRCLGPGGKERLVPIGPVSAERLKRYLEEARPHLLRQGSPERALFLSRGGTRMTRQSLWKLIKKYAAACGVADPVTPHTLRHSFAAHLLDNGADPRAVQEMLGHADLSTTQMYSQSVRSGIKDAYDRAHPRARK